MNAAGTSSHLDDPGGSAPGLTVVMPAHNEEAYLVDAVRAVADGLSARPGGFEILVVENGSVDRTAEVAATLAAEMAEVRVIGLTDADYGLALRAGLLEATGALVVNYDVDFVDLDFLHRAVEVMDRDGAAIVVGTKRGPGASDDRNLARRTVTAVFSLVLQHGFGLKVSDTHGLKLLDRATVADLAGRCRFGKDIFDTELVLRAERAGLVVAEIPVDVSDQRPPRTSIARRIPRSLIGLVQLRVRLARDRRGGGVD